MKPRWRMKPYLKTRKRFRKFDEEVAAMRSVLMALPPGMSLKRAYVSVLLGAQNAVYDGLRGGLKLVSELQQEGNMNIALTGDSYVEEIPVGGRPIQSLGRGV